MGRWAWVSVGPWEVCVGECVGGLVEGTMWVRGSGRSWLELVGVGWWGSVCVRVGGWAGGSYHVGVWNWVGVGWWEVCG